MLKYNWDAGIFENKALYVCKEKDSPGTDRLGKFVRGQIRGEQKNAASTEMDQAVYEPSSGSNEGSGYRRFAALAAPHGRRWPRRWMKAEV
ncbi:hypothetical protein E2P81_ATG06207 [Venturia nashicola]|nr:hypothetical protein E2P81_ATG06207 [Venturia nashicola]